MPTRQTELKRKTKPTNRKTTQRSQKPQKAIATKKRGFMRGASGRQNVDVELEKSAARKAQRDKEMNKPFRFRMREGEEDREVVILDEEPDFFMYEHTLQSPDTGYYNLFLSCCQIFDVCAVCESAALKAPASYNMVLSVLDLQEYTTKRGDVIPYSRKLFIVKPKQHKKFIRLYEKHGTLRGLRLVLARDGNKDPVIGSDIEFDGFMDEDELTTHVREYADREGKNHVDDCSQPFVYEDVFDEPDPDLLRESVPDSEYTPGSPQANDNEPVKAGDAEEGEYGDDDGSDMAWEEDEEDEEDEENEEDEADEDEVEKPVRQSRRTSSKTSNKPVRRASRRGSKS